MATYLFTVASLVRKLKAQRREHIEKRRPSLVEALKQMGDFYMELKWDFASWGEEHSSYELFIFLLFPKNILIFVL